jgi:hypothetical protein
MSISKSLIKQSPEVHDTFWLAGYEDSSRRDKSRKGLADLSADTITLDVTETRHGPIVFERDGKRYALRWTALDQLRTSPIPLSIKSRTQLEEFSKAWKRSPLQLRTLFMQMWMDTLDITRLVVPIRIRRWKSSLRRLNRRW